MEDAVNEKLMKISDKEHTQDGRTDAEKFDFAIASDATGEIIGNLLMVESDEGADDD